ncbi:MAG: hypothetical protein KatS3mg115_0105 [Candidatus Poribacteria bacterium]|nr:MAG: hypothetical protein KatS3mg115_0105 [Candidatus Poribacteria bacterium]
MTYALCNAEFDPYLFRHFLDDPDDRLGVLYTAALAEGITNAEGTSCLPGLQQYILLGDPALRLQRPSHRIPVILNSQALNPGQELRIFQGSVQDVRRQPPQKDGSYQGTLQAWVLYPNDLDFDATNDINQPPRETPVVGGEFGDIAFTISNRTAAGEGIVRLLGISPQGIAIGGARFSLRQSRILSVEHRQEGPRLRITVRLANPSGAAGVRSVRVEWTNTEDFRLRTQELVSQAGLVYVTDPPIELPGLGKRLKYTVIVTDQTGREIESPMYEFRMPLGPDFRIAEFGRTQIPEVSYEFDTALGRWVFRVVVANRGDQRPEVPVSVYLLYGDADRDGNWVLDPDAQVLGTARIAPEDWYHDPKQPDDFERAVAVIPLEEPLRSGLHTITFWVDPERGNPGPSEEPRGEVDESLDLNNRITRTIEINDFIVGDEDTVAYSLDRTARVFVPAGATPKTTLSIVREVPPATVPFDAPEAPLVPVPSLRLADPERSAYRLRLQSGAQHLDKPIQLAITFDTGALRRNLAAEIGLSPFEEEWTPADIARLDRELGLSYPFLGIYRWAEDEGVWKKVGGALQLTPEGSPAETIIVTEPVPNGAIDRGLKIGSLEVDPDLTPLGRWAIFFLNSEEYEVLLETTGDGTYQRLASTGRLNELYSEPNVGIRTLVVTNDSEFRPVLGDTLGFETVLGNDGRVLTTRFRSSNRGNGTVQLFLDPDVSVEEAPIGDWVFFLIGDRYYELRDARGVPLRNASGSRAIGIVDGIRLAFSRQRFEAVALSGTEPFAFGDTFRVRVGRVRSVEAQTDRTGLYALLRDRDQQPPRVQVWVDKQPVQSGQVIPPRPEISFLITDPNGIDRDSVRYRVHAEGGLDFAPPRADQFSVDFPDYASARLTHRPVLFPGVYRLRLEVRDLAGMSVGTETEPYLLFTFQVTQMPDITPPSFSLSADGAPVRPGDVLVQTPARYSLTIQDDYGLDVKTLQLSLQPAGAEPEPIERYEVVHDPAAPSVVRVSWDGDLPNGVYTVRAQMADTSANVGYLGGEQNVGITFTIDEPAVFDGMVLNAPNPFNPLSAETRGTFFTFRVTQPAERAIVKIYTVAGRLVRTLESSPVQRGLNEIYWDGRDASGRLLANGVYFYKVRLEAVHLGQPIAQERTGKLAILR